MAPFLAIALLGGCGPAADPSVSSGASTAASSAPTGGAASPGASQASPAAAEPSASAARELTASPAPLPPGTYTVAAFMPPVTLDIDGTWTSVNRFVDFFDVQQDVGSPDVVAVQVARPSALAGSGGTTPAPGDPAAAVDVLRANSGLTIIEESESRMSGLTGRQVTIENATGTFVEVLVVGQGAVSIDTGRRLWMAFFATPRGLVVVMVGGSVATWDHALTVAEPVLESVRISG